VLPTHCRPCWPVSPAGMTNSRSFQNAHGWMLCWGAAAAMSDTGSVQQIQRLAMLESACAAPVVLVTVLQVTSGMYCLL
jgi:hypothetical protein